MFNFFCKTYAAKSTKAGLKASNSAHFIPLHPCCPHCDWRSQIYEGQHSTLAGEAMINVEQVEHMTCSGTLQVNC